MTSIIQDILGVYTPLKDSSGNIIPTIAGVDFSYLVRAILLIMSVYIFFKFLYSLFR